MTEPVANHNLLDLIIQAGPVVKLVMLGLLFASAYSWVIIGKKWRRFQTIHGESNRFEELFWSGGSIAKLYQTAMKDWPTNPMVSVFAAGYREWHRWESGEQPAHGGNIRESEVGDLVDSVRRAMTATLNREVDQLEQGLTFLATVGSTSPFIGLFGTVWGIMNAFMGLAGAKTTTLAMVAPGIAEALIATAIGLVAAIPAVIAFNKFSADLRRLHQQIDNFGAEFLNILERRAARIKGAN
jgi:biopolymer transport protein TolQ